MPSSLKGAMYDSTDLWRWILYFHSCLSLDTAIQYFRTSMQVCLSKTVFWKSPNFPSIQGTKNPFSDGNILDYCRSCLEIDIHFCCWAIYHTNRILVSSPQLPHLFCFDPWTFCPCYAIILLLVPAEFSSISTASCRFSWLLKTWSGTTGYEKIWTGLFFSEYWPF